MINISHDPETGEIILRTPQGTIIINECHTPKLTRIVLSPNQGSYVSMSEGSPSIMAMWTGIRVQEPAEVQS